MDEFNEFREPLNTSTDDEDMAPPADDDLRSELTLEDRLRRVREYADNEFCTAGSRNAALRIIAADLMEQEIWIAQLVRDSIRNGTMVLDDLDVVEPAIDLSVRLAKQIAQIAQIEARSGGPSLTNPYPPH